MSALNTYLREQEAEAKAKQEAKEKTENIATTKVDSKAGSKVDTGVESFATGYVASAGLALAGLAVTKRRRKK